MSNFKELLVQVKSLCDSRARIDEKMQRTCQLLQAVEGYDLVEHYFLDQERGDRLILGATAGATNPHHEIPIGKGICGQAAERQITIVLNDITQELNYLRVNDDIQSEIVLPLFRVGRFCGVLDVLSNQKARFTEHDRLFLEEVALLLTDLT